jgi:N-dimethylarginine dimethylaminohydrolase
LSIAEFSETPNAIIVHDPVASGSFDTMSGLPEDVLQEELLYRLKPNDQIFADDHRRFVEVMTDNVAHVHYLADLLAGSPEYDTLAANPNQVYTRDALITLPTAPGRYIPGRMFSPIRRLEPVAMRFAAARLGLEPLVELPAGIILEGGDVVPFARGETRTLLVGFGRRTTRDAVNFLFDALHPMYIDDVIGVELASWRINLDGALVPVAEDVAIVQPESLLGAVHVTRSGTAQIDVLDVLRDSGTQLVEVSIDESIYQQACNCLCLGDRRIICYDLCPTAIESLALLDVKALTVPGAELVKGRGGPRCMSRPIYLPA